MRKIKHISHLQKEKQRLRREGRDMERTIRRDWQTLYKDLQPATLAKEALSSCTTWIGKKILSR
ncbi:hypothetical protein Q4E93_02725 [Flavitalea sp. BT771]|uniref:hypothetical protein n=1 Tax=Flavitalea sp. BT771 TaxID=3063329 RepID=UPI0026E46DB1|nr:hypothetical protein [Flavitalea sp. BT771]MDO6429486.1 hypothetical protein [Flavitalea sp. BT771]MDV6218386.1 hypothetical protein [Flavitalea sp. BT771]